MPTKEHIHGWVLKLSGEPYLATMHMHGYVWCEDVRIFPPVGAGLFFSMIEKPLFDVMLTEFDRHTETRQLLAGETRWSYELHFLSLSPSQRTLLLNHFLARHGNHQAMTFEHPGTQEWKIVRFMESIQHFNLFRYKLYQLNKVTLIEVDEDFTMEDLP
jgi:hypothetical protein